MKLDLEKLNWWSIHILLYGKEHNQLYIRKWKAEHPPTMICLQSQGPSRATNHIVGTLLPPDPEILLET